MKTRNKIGFIPLLLTLLLVVMMVAPTMSMAVQPPVDRVDLGTTSTFAVLAYSKISDAGAQTKIYGKSPEGGGDVGLSPKTGTFITGLTTQNVEGTIYAVDIFGPAGPQGNNPSKLTQAKNDLDKAYLDAAGRTPTKTFTATDNQLGGQTLKSGVYAFGHADTANLTALSPLILDAEGNENAVFIFQASSDLIMASGSEIRLINGAKYCRVFWQVTSSATLETGAIFVGHIFALASITAKTGATVQGQLLARTGAVTLDHNIITNELCETTTPTLTPTPTPTLTPTPTPTLTPTPTPTLTPTPTPTPTLTPTPTATATAIPAPTVTGGKVVTTTVSGGQLPKTSTHLYELLLIGAVLTLVGAIGWISRKRYE